MWEDGAGVGVVLYCTCSLGMVALFVCVFEVYSFTILPSAALLPPPSLLPLLVPSGGRNLSLWSGTNIIVLKHAHIYISLHN